MLVKWEWRGGVDEFIIHVVYDLDFTRGKSQC